MVMMDDLVLVGSSPPTFRGSTPAPPSDRLQQNTYQVDSSRLNSYFNSNGRGSTPQKQPSRKGSGKISTYGGRTGHSVPATDRTSEADWPKPTWGSSEKALENATRYTINRYDQTRPATQTPGRESRPGSQMSMSRGNTGGMRPQSRTSSANQNKAGKSRPTSAKKNAFKASYVDELLFGTKMVGPEFPSPWNDQRPTRGHAFDYTNYKGKSEESIPSSRPSSRTRVPRHSTSYVDESLFGPKPVDPGWEAPWSKPDPKNIQMFDEFQHKVTIKHNDVEIVRPKSSVYMRKARPQSSGKPVWK